MPFPAVLEDTGFCLSGLTEDEAARRRERYGPDEFWVTPRLTAWPILLG
jgi:hypothetical protein